MKKLCSVESRQLEVFVKADARVWSGEPPAGGYGRKGGSWPDTGKLKSWTARLLQRLGHGKRDGQMPIEGDFLSAKLGNGSTMEFPRGKWAELATPYYRDLRKGDEAHMVTLAKELDAIKEN